MSLKINLFDFLSYTIPGVFYSLEIFFIVNYFLTNKLHILEILKNINIAQVFLLMKGYIKAELADIGLL